MYRAKNVLGENNKKNLRLVRHLLFNFVMFVSIRKFEVRSRSQGQMYLNEVFVRNTHRWLSLKKLWAFVTWGYQLRSKTNFENLKLPNSKKKVQSKELGDYVEKITYFNSIQNKIAPFRAGKKFNFEAPLQRVTLHLNLFKSL